jgi:hypothetical protein
VRVSIHQLLVQNRSNPPNQHSAPQPHNSAYKRTSCELDALRTHTTPQKYMSNLVCTKYAPTLVCAEAVLLNPPVLRAATPSLFPVSYVVYVHRQLLLLRPSVRDVLTDTAYGKTAV